VGFATTFLFREMILLQICDDYDKVIYSVKHNVYIIINTQLATHFGSSDLSPICKEGTMIDPGGCVIW
jgi:hypothetical protein